MPQTNGLSLNGAKVISTANQTRNANSVLHLFKSGFLPSPTTTKAEFLAQECDFDGYSAATIAAWGAPVLLGTAWATYAPTQTFRWALDTDAVGNLVGGYFLVTAGGDLMDYAIFDPPVPVTGPGQAVVTTPIQVTPAGTPVSM
jgi:hypothetical protein